MKDWRSNYIICPHIKKNTPNEEMISQGFLVCCKDCYKKGFLKKETRLIFNYIKENNLIIGRYTAID